MTDQTTDQATEPLSDPPSDPPLADTPVSEYIAARKEWDDRFAGQRKTVRVLTAITFLALALAGLGMGYGMYTGARTQFIPHVLQVDTLGRIEPAPPPELVDDWPPEVIRRELGLFFERLRGVSPDLTVIGNNHRAVEKFLLSGAAAANKLRDYHRDPRNNPVSRAKTETVSIEVISVNFVSGSTWRVEWVETVYGRESGREIDTRRFVATTQITFRRPTSRALLKDNPLGLFITDLDIQEIRT